MAMMCKSYGKDQECKTGMIVIYGLCTLCGTIVAEGIKKIIKPRDKIKKCQKCKEGIEACNNNYANCPDLLKKKEPKGLDKWLNPN
jgi:hypothetical protein